MDLVHELVGPETYVTTHQGCPAGMGAELWTIEHGKHAPGFNAMWGPMILEWLSQQSKAPPP